MLPVCILSSAIGYKIIFTKNIWQIKVLPNKRQSSADKFNTAQTLMSLDEEFAEYKNVQNIKKKAATKCRHYLCMLPASFAQ